METKEITEGQRLQLWRNWRRRYISNHGNGSSPTSRHGQRSAKLGDDDQADGEGDVLVEVDARSHSPHVGHAVVEYLREPFLYPFWMMLSVYGMIRCMRKERKIVPRQRPLLERLAGAHTKSGTQKRHPTQKKAGESGRLCRAEPEKNFLAPQLPASPRLAPHWSNSQREVRADLRRSASTKSVHKIL